MSKKQADLKLGDLSESQMTPILRQFFKDETMEKTKDPFGAIDFIGEKCFCELKTRRINHDKYYTGIIGNNKLRAFKKSGKENFIVYRYSDGVFYIPYDEELFSTFDTALHDTWRDGRCESSMVTYIPRIHLKKMILEGYTL